MVNCIRNKRKNLILKIGYYNEINSILEKKILEKNIIKYI